jgi:hypothetical protein
MPRESQKVVYFARGDAGARGTLEAPVKAPATIHVATTLSTPASLPRGWGHARLMMMAIALRARCRSVSSRLGRATRPIASGAPLFQEMGRRLLSEKESQHEGQRKRQRK